MFRQICHVEGCVLVNNNTHILQIYQSIRVKSILLEDTAKGFSMGVYENYFLFLIFSVY